MTDIFIQLDYRKRDLLETRAVFKLAGNPANPYSLTMNVLTVLGTRPEIIKLSPLLPLFDEEFNHTLVHTGQHYAFEMDQVFFEGLQLRDPDETLEVGSDDGLSQTAAIMTGLRTLIDKIRPELVVVQGDTNSTLAGALAAAKSGIRLAHIEAGCRSFNMTMPEEINRTLTDHCADLLFAPDEDAVGHLSREGITPEKVYLTGSTLADACHRNVQFIDKSDILSRLNIKPGGYLLATVHRAENTDDRSALLEIVKGLSELAKIIPVVFPIHPRTSKVMKKWGIDDGGIKVIDPVGYLDFLNLLSNARFALTDSGGVQEEAAAFDVPALILRDETEWMSYVRAGKNKLVGREAESIATTGQRLLEKPDDLEKMRLAHAPIPTGATAEIMRVLLAGL